MKYLILTCLIMAGCSTVSEYNKGCRDGITQFNDGKVDTKEVNIFCDDVDAAHKAEQKAQTQNRR